ncbi:FAD-dependent oxidoreductase [Streptomyces sp. NPDC017964]|uniref:FAD-dependent oxidoreductase n=1 Tax=Streptomyces sp. NPDC017964 TaxID=3365022 RepID=UPI0037919808
MVVLEARDRVGGRIWTDRTAGFSVDRGASWIHGLTGNPLTGLVTALEMETHEFTVASFQAGGRPIADYDESRVRTSARPPPPASRLPPPASRLPPTVALTSPMRPGLTARHPARGKSRDQLAQMLARQPAEGRMGHGRADLFDLHTPDNSRGHLYVPTLTDQDQSQVGPLGSVKLPHDRGQRVLTLRG